VTTPSVQDIAEALETALKAIPGIRTFPYLPDTFTPPVALIHVDEVEYHGAFQGGDVTHAFTVFLVVGRADDRTAINALEGFMSQKGDNSPTSVQGAIEADQSLGGVVSTLVVEKSGPVAPITIPGSDVVYLAVPFAVTVHA
jgi:hypothetical protein